MRDRGGVDPGRRGGWEERGGQEKGKTVLWLYYRRKESMFNKKGKKSNNV